jgi:alpha-beta hydrolase superfamily lysophospholipase
VKIKPLLRYRYLAAAFAVVLVGSGCAWLGEKQGELIFSPVKGDWRGAPSSPGYAEHWIPVGGNGGQLHAWWVESRNPQAPVMLYLHGARWNLSGSTSRIARWRDLGFSVLAIDYRGFGQSTDVPPSEQLSYEDAQSAWNYLAKLAPGKRRFIVGHSLGGAIAVDLAVRNPEASGLVVEATFTSVREMIATQRWWYAPVGFLLTQEFDSRSKIGSVRMPVMVVHGTEDRVVPYEMGEHLYEAAPEPKRFIRVEGGSHHNLSAAAFEEYRRTLAELFQVKLPSVQAGGS